MVFLKSKDIPFTLMGNPFHLDDEICRMLKVCGCEKYQMSLDGMRETHDWFRKQGSFDLDLEKVGCLNRAGIKSIIMSTVSKTNMDEMPDVIDAVVLPSNAKEGMIYGGCNCGDCHITISSNGAEAALLLPMEQMGISMEQISREKLETILEAGNFAPNAGGGQRSMMVAIHNKELASHVGKMNMAYFDRTHLVGSFVSKEQPSTIDDPSTKNGFYDAPTVICIFAQNNFMFKTADAFCMAENMILQATELGIASCIISSGYETFDNEEGQKLMKEWEVPEGYTCQCFVIFGYIDGEQPHSKPRKPGRIKIIE